MTVIAIDDYHCRENVCVLRPICGLDIKKNTLSSADLWKDKKITFKILTTSFGAVDLGPDIHDTVNKGQYEKGYGEG